MAKLPARRTGGPLPADTTHERAMLERHLLRQRAAPLFPGLWAGDSWIPGVKLADSWTLAWSPAGMPLLGIPLGFSVDDVVRTLGIARPAGRRSRRQHKEWEDAGVSPEESWEDRVRQPIGNPLLALLASSTLDDVARDHARAPSDARKLHASVVRTVKTLRRQLGSVPRCSSVSTRGGPWHVGSLRHLLHLYARC